MQSMRFNISLSLSLYIDQTSSCVSTVYAKKIKSDEIWSQRFPKSWEVPQIIQVIRLTRLFSVYTYGIF